MTDMVAGAVDTAIPTGAGSDVATSTRPGHIEYSGHGARMFALGFRIGALTTLTLGIYRFWGKTRLRGYLWSHVSVLGDPLEYTGRAVELLIGFLIAAAILGPLFIVFSVVQALLAPLQQLYVIVPLFLLLMLLSGVAVFAAWRYILSRTLWRGIRMGLSGSAWNYAFISFGWGLVELATLGLIHPVADRARTRLIARQAMAGSTPFGFDVPLRLLMMRWLGVWLVSYVGLVVLVAFSFGGMMAARAFDPRVLDNPEAMGRMLAENMLPMIVPFGLWLLASIAASGLYSVWRMKVYANGLSLGETRLICDLSVIRYWAVMILRTIAVQLVVIVPAVLLYVLFLVLLGALVADGSPLIAVPVAIALLTIASGAYLGLRLSWVTHALLGRIVQSCSLSDPCALDRLSQGRLAMPSRGEGLADALDINVTGF